jgi:molecular chaperone IbpA
MNKFFDFDLSPFAHTAIGFDTLERVFRGIGENKKPNYPPYNIEKIQDSTDPGAPDEYRLVLAVAGFQPADISITVYGDQNLHIASHRGIDGETEKSVGYIHHGIAMRDFALNFYLDKQIHVVSADMRDGLLIISLHRENPVGSAVTIPITTGPSQVLLGDGPPALSESPQEPAERRPVRTHRD